MPHGKICYLEIPATNVDASAAFYTKVFGWATRTRGDGHKAFDDATGNVGGTWVLGRTPSREPSVLVYVMVDDIEATLKRIVGGGGQIATPRAPAGPGGGMFATFTDPVGNLLGLYQEGAR
jgi:predicted enzyme related to lactoylglutathione lyase